MTDLPLSGIKVIDFTGVQAGPACTQMLAWLGADVLKVERTSGGDVTRNQLRDIPDLDALYFTMLNSNKRSLAINTKSPEGLEVMEKLLQTKLDWPAVPLSSNPNWMSPTVTSPHQPWVRSQLRTARTSTVPELVALVRTNE